MLLLSRLFLLGVTAISASGFAAVQYPPLKDLRDKLVLPNYTAQDRQTLADQADFMLRNLYVHREQKIQDFQYDPLPHLDTLKKNAQSLSNEEFHKTLSEIFLSLHDLHTNYIAPKPVACGTAFIPVQFHSVGNGDSQSVVVSQLLKLHQEAVTGITVKDELLEVDGRPVEDALGDLKKLSGGSNADAMRFRSVQMLSLRSLATQAVPAADSVHLKLRGDAGVYEKEIPWFALVTDTCLSGQEDGRGNTKLSEMMNLAQDEYQKRFNRIFGSPFLTEPERSWAVANPLSEVFDVSVLDTPAGKLGYIHLKAFYWDNKSLDTETVLQGFRRAVESRLTGTIGIVIDVRGNPGGLIPLAEKLVQLFSTRVVDPTTVRMLPNALNEQIFMKANGTDNRWSEAVRDGIKLGAKYTAPLTITSKAEANTYGQVWFRPTLVLTDAACFSACDLFAAEMQDSGAGVIIGLDRNTGAGGANVMEYNNFRAIMGTGTDNPFVQLPFGQNMRVSWRQTLRAGKHQGELIEDKGIESDFIVPLKKEDIGAEPKALMRQIHSIIEGLTPKYQSGIGLKPGGIVLLTNGKSASWTEQVYGVDSITVSTLGKTLATLPVVPSDSPKDFQVNLDSLQGNWINQHVVLTGKRGGVQVFRGVRELIWRGEYEEIPKEGLVSDFADGKIGAFHTVLLKGPTEQSGWQVVNGKFRIGPGPLYDNGVFARAFLPLKLASKATTMIFDISLVAEDVNDNLRLYVNNPDTGDRLQIFAGSKLNQLKDVKIPLPSDWDRADVVFEFESDENWNFAGPEIGNVRIVRDGAN